MDAFAELAALLRSSVGLRLDPRRDDALHAALERAGVTTGLAPEALVDRVLAGEVPLQPIVEQVMIGETCFFRDQAQWSYLERTILSKPSGTYLFESVARSYGPAALGLILSGMGRDGVHGLAALRAAGGTVVAQDRESSVIFGMNGEAVLAGLTDEVLPLDALAYLLMPA